MVRGSRTLINRSYFIFGIKLDTETVDIEIYVTLYQKIIRLHEEVTSPMLSKSSASCLDRLGT